MTTSQVSVRDDVLAGPHGLLGVRVYQPALSPVGGLVWAHGGGFFSGDLEMPESDWVAKELAAAGFTVVAVDYRLAPVPDWVGSQVTGGELDRAHFPVASEEVTFAFLNAPSLDGRVPIGRWSIGGASAGGTLAASAALRLRDGDSDLLAVVLAYPLLHAALPEMSDELRSKHDDQPVQERLSPETVDLLNFNYVGDPAHLDHEYAFAGGKDLSEFAPTMIITSDVDSLRASGELFATELITAGVETTVFREVGTRHGHLNEPENPAARRSVHRIARWLRLRPRAPLTD